MSGTGATTLAISGVEAYGGSKNIQPKLLFPGMGWSANSSDPPVGAGTFMPVRSERIEDHRMHAEYLEVSAQCCAAINAARQRGSRVIAVGTTTVRSLETAATHGQLDAFTDDSRLFIMQLNGQIGR